MVESGFRELLGLDLCLGHSCTGRYRIDIVPAAGLEGIFGRVFSDVRGRLGNDSRLPSRSGSSCGETSSCDRAGFDFLLCLLCLFMAKFS